MQHLPIGYWDFNRVEQQTGPALDRGELDELELDQGVELDELELDRGE
jgi:hypothetical protein